MKQSENHSQSELSIEERAVLRFIAEGKIITEIALALNESPTVIESHRQSIMAKLRLYTVAELTRYAVQNGLTGVEKE